jgi:hypothetical protein
LCFEREMRFLNSGHCPFCTYIQRRKQQETYHQFDSLFIEYSIVLF